MHSFFSATATPPVVAAAAAVVIVADGDGDGPDGDGWRKLTFRVCPLPKIGCNLSFASVSSEDCGAR